MFLWLPGLTDMVQRLHKLRTYLQACLKRSEKKTLQYVPFLINTTCGKHSFNRRCTIWISPTLYGLLSLFIRRIHFIWRSWIVNVSQGNWTPHATFLEGGRGGEASLACLDDEMELICTFWIVSTLKIVKEKI